MKIINVPEPKNWNAEKHGECATIEAHRDEDGFTVTLEFEPGEFAALLMGGTVKLKIFGASFPPVALWVAE